MSPVFLIKSVLWIAPYFAAGFAAPVIFKHAPNPVVGGHYAGALFVCSGIWSLVVAFRHRYYSFPKLILFFVLFLEVMFWLWRFVIDRPLSEAHFLGVSGTAIHLGLTTAYLFVGAILVLLEFSSRPR